jgi:hypothetical protein
MAKALCLCAGLFIAFCPSVRPGSDIGQLIEVINENSKTELFSGFPW